VRNNGVIPEHLLLPTRTQRPRGAAFENGSDCDGVSQVRLSAGDKGAAPARDFRQSQGDSESDAGKGVACRQKRSFVVKTTDSNHPYPVFPNRIKNLVVTRLNQVWVADITYVRLYRGFAYLAAILDKLSRKVVGYAMSLSITRDLTLSALKMAVTIRRPAPGCIHHSDRGVQYAAHEYVDYLREQKFEISMSAKGNPYDNAVAESFMKTYKYDEVYLSDYESFGEALQNTGRFIEAVYNAKRLHSSLGYVPPNEFEENWLKKQGPVLTLQGPEKCILTNLNAEKLEPNGILATI